MASKAICSLRYTKVRSKLAMTAFTFSACSVSSKPARRSSATQRLLPDDKQAGARHAPLQKIHHHKRRSQDIFNGGRHAQAGELGGVVFARMRGLLEMKMVRRPRARSARRVSPALGSRAFPR